MRDQDRQSDSGDRWVKTNGRDGAFVTRHIAGETLVIPVAGQVGDLDAIYTLNEVASTIWKTLEDPTAVRQIVDTLGGEYDVTPGQAQADVLEFLDTLAAKGLIRLAADTAGETGSGQD